MEELTGLQRDLLVAITGSEEAYGLALKSELNEYYQDPVFRTRLYQNLNWLVEGGLVETARIDDRTKSSTLTGHGRHVLAERRAREN